jgi:hypothetical protein
LKLLKTNQPLLDDPTWQESQVSRAYAGANIWGKIKLHEAVIRHQLLELEAEQWEIQCRRNTIEESADSLKEALPLPNEHMWHGNKPQSVLAIPHKNLNFEL